MIYPTVLGLSGANDERHTCTGVSGNVNSLNITMRLGWNEQTTTKRYSGAQTKQEKEERKIGGENVVAD